MTSRAGAGGSKVGSQAAYAVAATVVDPELPMLTLEDLGVLRSVEEVDGVVTVAITPTYSGCPALASMRDDLVHRLHDAGWYDVQVRVDLAPPWSSDHITPRGRRALSDAGLSPPGPAPGPRGPVAIDLSPTRRELTCPQCGTVDVALTSEFGATACKALYRCCSCLEPFEHVKEI